MGTRVLLNMTTTTGQIANKYRDHAISFMFFNINNLPWNQLYNILHYELKTINRYTIIIYLI